jgi:molybdate transport system ATP-binding protein
MNPLMQIELHEVSVRRGKHWALERVSVTLGAGERWALIGANGAGKTQFLKVLSGDVWPTPRGATGGAVIYTLAGHRVDRHAAKRCIAYLGGERQDKYARYAWNLHVRDVVATGLHGTDLLLEPVTPTQRRRVATMLRACGLKGLAMRRFLTLSYGQKRLVLLARALVQRPAWLLFDELYNGLDTRFRARIDTILAAARKRGQAWIAAAHRAADVPRGTHRLLELEAGAVRAVKDFERSDALRLASRADEPLAPLRPLPQPRQSPQPGRLRPRRPAARGPLLLLLSRADLYVEYRPVLRGIDWELRTGQHWAVFGANGAGKSSFLKLLYGDLSPALGGQIERRGHPRGTPITSWKRRVGFVSPELQADYAIDVSLVDLVASGRHASIGLVAAASAADRRAALRWLKFFGLASKAQCRPRELSYGQLRRALLARALVAKPRLLLLDEPLTGLDPAQRAILKSHLARLMARGITLVMAVHHAEDLPRGITHVLNLHKRRAVARELDELAIMRTGSAAR